MRTVSDLVERVEETSSLDRVTRPVATWLRRRFRGTTAKDVAHGVPLGHPAHPGLVLLPTGSLVAATTLDLVPGTERAREALTAVGLTSSLPAAVAGLADWSELRDEQQRVGLVHAAMNAGALTLFALSLASDVRGRRGRAKALRLAGAAVIGTSGFVGGHLAHRQAVGANHAEQTPFQVGPGWHRLCAVDDLPSEGRPVRMLLDGTPLLVAREGDKVHVLGEQCSHLAGPLADGTVVVEGGASCIKCPWHGSTFALEDGHVVHGPATSPAPSFGVRVVGGTVEVHSPTG